MNIQHYRGRTDAWRLFWEVGRDEEGKRRQASEVFHGTKKEARQRWLQEAARYGAHDAVRPERITVEELLERWLADVASVKTRPTTMDQYRSLVENHLVPALGRIPLQKLTAADVQRMIAAKSRDGGRADGRPGPLAPSSVRTLHVILRSAIGQAVRWRLVQENVAALVDKPRLPKKEMRFWLPDDVERFLAAAAEHRLYAAFTLALTTGMREGEILGLCWEDVDLAGGSLRVRQTLTRQDGRLVLGSEPKSAKSRRNIDLGPETVEILRQHRARQLRERLMLGAAWHDYGLVFPTEVGTPSWPDNFRRAFRSVCRRACVPVIRPHDMRHTHGTTLMALGVPLTTIQERLGHHAPSVTLLYTHAVSSMQREAAQKADDAMLRGARRKKGGGMDYPAGG